MLELLIFIAAAGSIIAGLWDLKTTEVPDEVPTLMISLGLFIHFVNAAITGDFYLFYLSMLIGTLLLLIGLAMYKKGQWGGADAWMLAAIGYLIPIYNGKIFMISYLFNFLIISAAYMVVYAIIIGLINKSVLSHFKDELKLRSKIVAGIPLAYAIFIIFMLNFVPTYASIVPIIYTFLLVTFLTIFWVYGKTIEKYAFRKKIPVSKLKSGDVLEEMLWRGITEEEIKDIRKKKKFVVVKEGVRFVPVFPITLIVTLLYGNILLMLLGF